MSEAPAKAPGPAPEADPASALSAGDEAALRAARVGDAALALPAAGFALFTPPLIGLFASAAPVGGAPLIVVYLFLAWAGLVGCAFALSRRLARGAAPRVAGEGDA